MKKTYQKLRSCFRGRFLLLLHSMSTAFDFREGKINLRRDLRKIISFWNIRLNHRAAYSTTFLKWKTCALSSFTRYYVKVHWGHNSLKVAFSQKGLMRLSFLQTGKPNYFPELKFWILFPSKWLKSCQKRTLSSSEWSKKALEQLKVLFWHDLSHLEGKRIQNFSSGK